MALSRLFSTQRSAVNGFFFSLAAAWTALFGFFAYENYSEHHSLAVQVAEAMVREAYTKDLAYRRFLHGRAYVPALTESEKPHFQENTPDAEIVTPSGTILTLLTPSYTARLLQQGGLQQYGMRRHVTSLAPLDPANRPDDWERAALERLQKGEKDVMAVEPIGSEPYIRFMGPFPMEERCATCHKGENLKPGELQGGIGLSIPWKPVEAAVWSQVREELAEYAVVWVLGLFGLLAARSAVSRKHDELAAAARDLEAANRQMTSILVTSPAATAMTVHRIVQWANDAWLELFGFEDPADVVGRDARMLYPSDAEYERVGHAYQLLADGKPSETEAVFLRRDGTTFDGMIRFNAVDPADQDKGVISAIVDFTERKEAERKLMLSEQRLQRALEGAELAWWDVDLRSGEVKRSESWARMLGYSPDEIRADPMAWQELLHPEDRDRVLKQFGAHVQGESSLFECEYRIARKDGGWKWIHDRGKIMEWDADEGPVRITGTLLDIDRRKQLEEERLEMERRLLYAQKLKSLGVMAAGIAHDFNNLLHVVLGNLEMAQTHFPAGSPARSFIEKSMKAGQRAAELSGLMWAYTGTASFSPKEIDLNSVVEQSEGLLRSLVPRTADLIIEKGDCSHAIAGEAGQIQQVLVNIVTNAAEALSETPGTIRVITGETECDAAYLARTRRELEPKPGRYVFLEVSDTGTGMDTHSLDLLFDPFFSTKFMGRGLGMAAVLGIVRGHNGCIDVQSGPGKGTKVRVLFPASGPVRGQGGDSGFTEP